VCTVLVIQQMPTKCVQAHDNSSETLPHIILCLSTRRPQTIVSPGHVRTCFVKSHISKNSVFQDQDFFSKNRQKIIKKNSWGAPPLYGAAPLPPTKVGVEYLSAMVLVNQDCARSRTGASVTTFRAWAKTIINSTSTGTWTTCVDITTTNSGCKPFSGCDATSRVGTISNHIYLFENGAE